MKNNSAKTKNKITSEVFRKDVLKTLGKTNDFFKGLEFFSDQRCPDQYVGKISTMAQKKCFPTRIDFQDFLKSNIGKNIFLLLLESPHQDEFEYAEDYNNRKAIGPANGYTGVNIWKYIKMIFDKDFLNDYALVLMNPIQYQCSLGSPTKDFRDIIFTSLWKKYQENFEERIKRLNKYVTKCSSNLLIVNACTQKFQQRVQKAMFSVFSDNCCCNIDSLMIPYCCIAHPSCWNKGGQIPKPNICNKAFKDLFQETKKK